MQDNNVTTNQKTPNAKRETISELAHRHILDPNHTTTDEELRNALIEFNKPSDFSVSGLAKLAAVDSEAVIPSLPFEKENNTSRPNAAADEENSVPNPYNILD